MNKPCHRQPSFIFIVPQFSSLLLSVADMSKIFPLLCLILLYCSLFVSVITASQCDLEKSGGSVPQEKFTHLHFYLHEVYAGDNATAAMVVGPAAGYSNFGALGVADDPIREGPEFDSAIIGRCHGLVAAASEAGHGESSMLLTLVNLEFTAGPHADSSIAVFGTAVMGDFMERAIVGGTGEFRGARGYTVGKITNFPTELKLILEYNAYIWHY